MKKLFLLLAALITTIAVMAQNQTVSGTVTSAENGEPLIGATVMGVGTKIGTSTDIDGNFTLTLPSTVTKLQVSYVSMKTTDVTIVPGHLNIALENANTLSEVVVTGYGVQRKAAFTGAASVLDGDVIEKKSDVNFVKSLEGSVTGFQYNNSTSAPGLFGTVYVRGMSSLSSSSQPLYVVDGMPVNSDYEGLSSTNNNYFDPMAAYNPNDIESVTVLKDAAATAIYGSRAANGVIIITTKKGGEGKFNLNVDIKQGFTSMANNNMKYANAATTMDLFAKGYAARTGRSYNDAYDIILNNVGWDGVTDTDWVDAVTRKGYYQDYNISFNGTSGSTNYYGSIGYVDSEGLVINSGNTRYSGRVNVDTKYKYFSAGVNASLSWSKNNNFSQATNGSMTNPLVGAVSSMLPFDPVYNEDGTYYGAGQIYNPVAVNDKKLGDLNEVTNQTINANPWLRIDLPFGIWIKTNFGANLVDQTEYNYWSAIYNPQGANYNGLGQQYKSRISTLTWTNTIGWNKTFDEKHVIDLLLGQECQRYDYHYDYYSKTDFPFASSGMRDMTTAGSDNGSEYYRAESRLASYFVDAHYSYDNRYYLSASYRRDGSSVFGSSNRWGNFWSVGGKWRFSQEGFLNNATWLSNGAFRISYGTVGNQSLPSLYASRGYYAAGYNYNETPGMVPVQISNPDLTWETSRKFDVGLDLSLFNRVNLTFDYYNDVTADALYSVPLSMTTGLKSTYKNIGKIRNRGVELGLNGVAFTNRDVTVSLFANLTWNQNRVIKLADGSVEGTYSIIEEGHPYRQFYMPEYAGVNPENGMALYYLNAEGDETTEDYTAAAKRYVGSAEPKVYGAFGVNAKAYGFDFSMQFNYRLGGKVYDTGHSFTGWGMSLMTPLQTVADNSWTPETPDAKYPQYIYGDPYKSTSSNYSSRWMMNGSYLRLSNITFGYTIPANITKKALISKCRIYTSFDNVHTWTASDFIGYNPETYSSGVIAWQYPAAFTFTGGIQLTF
ncbi:MAG: TonB-dependent receptor [Bacteroides sp.]|nr:TonB-dependent receptor [Bacteroides sp.]MBD5301023.1 TonB-dependent receptor [Bacteroides sp.]MBD5353714.1 TonB-dependent receptor [Bacteroides sp.]MDE6824782.1 TonB-dependent receptor [Duncaniella sp.]